MSSDKVRMVLVACVCIIAVGAIAFYVSSNNNGGDTAPKTVSAPVEEVFEQPSADEIPKQLSKADKEAQDNLKALDEGKITLDELNFGRGGDIPADAAELGKIVKTEAVDVTPESDEPDILPEVIVSMISNEDLKKRLEPEGWALEGEGDKVEHGLKTTALKGEEKVTLELLEFPTTEAAVEYMMELEKNKNTSIGLTNNRLMAVIPAEGVERETTSAVLDLLMSKRAEDDFVGGKDPNKGKDAEPAKKGG